MLYNRIVVKVGTSTITHSTGKLDLRIIDKLSMVLSDIANRGIEVVLVTSGAIATGMTKTGLKKKPEDIAAKQAMAAIGQGLLVHIYEKMFSEYGKAIAQILLTKEDIFYDDRNANAKNTFNTLLKLGIIPIVNENDTVATDEIKFGDNDVLSAYVAKIIDADLLIILSDINGLYDRDPNLEGAKLIERVTHIDDTIRLISKGTNSAFGTGGMKTKINAAQIMFDNNITMVIANGRRIENIYDIISGKQVGTIFSREDS
ncbi:MAG: glutamate 5-kinase [Clostridiales bacterium]|nr:glutamate 5-kinase [Clostridiales bacterium]HBM79954.1 glutamate 5-kinase [Clostridiaceae bacterium]